MKQLLILALAIALFTLGVLGTATAGSIVNWGGTTCVLAKVLHEPYIATVTCHNDLTGGTTYNTGTVDLHGLSIGIDATMQPGRAPDEFTITPPEGFVAIPPQMTIGEFESGVTLIFSLAGMVMG